MPEDEEPDYTGHYCYTCGSRLVMKWFGDLHAEACPVCTEDKGK